jgi:hypothetical protein
MTFAELLAATAPPDDALLRALWLVRKGDWDGAHGIVGDLETGAPRARADGRRDRLGRMNLPKQSFLALAALGWVDGSLQRVEATGLLRAAKEAGLPADALAEIEAATKTKLDLAGIDVGGFSEWDQVLTYALAAWFAQVDGVVSTSESDLLGELGTKLGLAEPLRKRAAVAAYDVACLPEGGRPEKYDFQKLMARLKERMPQLAKGE